MPEQRAPRVLLSFGAWAGGLSGGDRHLLEMAARWRPHVELAVAAPAGAEAIFDPLLGDVPLSAPWPGDPGQGLVLAGQYVARASRAARMRYGTDIVIGSSHFLPDAAMVRAGVRGGALGVSYVYHLIGPRRDLSPRSLWSKADERLGLALLRDRAGVVFTSNTEADRALRAMGFATQHTDVGIALRDFPRASPVAAPPVGIFLARLAPTKGLLDAVQAFAAARSLIAEARLVVIGSGPQREEALSLAERLGCSAAIEWAGFVSEERKRELLASARLLIAPSYEEGWGITIAEAMACGLPVLAYRLPTLDEVFGETYRAIPLGEVEPLGAAMAELLADGRAAQARGEAARRHVQRYDLDVIADRELEVILRTRLSSNPREAAASFRTHAPACRGARAARS